MKISKLLKFAWAFFALALTTSTIFAQGWRNSNRGNYTQNYTCVDALDGLTDKQIDQLTALENQHQKEMAGFRIERRSTTDALEKNEIRGEMLKKVNAHRESVKNLLTLEQQEQYDLLHSAGNYYQNRPRSNQGRQRFNQNLGNNRGCMANRNGAGFSRGNNSGKGAACRNYPQNVQNTRRGRGFNYNN